MSSLTKRIAKGLSNPGKRASAIKARGHRSNAMRSADESGYETCHFTKGWRRISFARLRAQQRMAVMLDRGA
jgi:hypothetical protein